VFTLVATDDVHAATGDRLDAKTELILNTLKLDWRWLAAGMILLAGCADPELAIAESATTTLSEPVFPLPKGQVLKSITPTPRSWDSKGFTEAFQTAHRVTKVISITDPVDWFDAAGKPREQSKPYQDAQWQMYLSDQRGLQVMVQMDPYVTRRGEIPNLPAGVSPTFSDTQLRQAFIADALLRIDVYKSPIICLAMEINAYYEQHPKDFDNFVSLFAQTAAQIKQKSPSTWVCVSFQYEQLLGLYGGQNGLPTHEPHWSLLSKFAEHADAIGISSYPFVSLAPVRHSSPAELPSNYYRRIAEHTDLPIIFTELGWSASSSHGSSPEQQAAFIKRLPELLSGMDVRMINWNFLYDAKGFGSAFDEMGFLDGSGRQRPALSTWNQLRVR
jgi:hypothetical protein